MFYSAGHPDLQTIGISPITKKCMQANNKKTSLRKRATWSHSSVSAKTQNENKTKKLGYTDVAEYVLDKNIKTLKEFLSIAIKRKNEGEKGLFSLSKNSSKNVSDLIERTWDANTAPARQQNKSLTRMEKLNASSNTECIEGCNKKWLKCVKQVLQWNSINPHVFSAAIRKLLQKGRNKKLNILLIGPSNCGKHFLLQPLELNCKYFTSPAQGKYAWTGLDEAKVAFLNDFHWSKELVAWHEFFKVLLANWANLKIFLPQIYP